MHPPYTNGDLFAVQIASDAWGYCRMRNGMGLDVLGIFSRVLGMPLIDWQASELQRWPFYIFLEIRDGDPAIFRVGNVPFESKEAALMPPTYREPDAFEPRYTIEHRGLDTFTDNPNDLKGITKQITLIPATLAAFLRQKYGAGELAAVEVGPSEPVPVDPAAAQLEADAPTIVFAKIVQAIGPAEREVEYEEPLGEFLAAHDLGLITGGGTMQDKDGSVLFAGIDVEVDDPGRAVPLIAAKLAELGAPEGSVLEYVINDQPVVYPIRSRRR